MNQHDDSGYSVMYNDGKIILRVPMYPDYSGCTFSDHSLDEETANRLMDELFMATVSSRMDAKKGKEQ